jgi:IclR family KDG regulon transcriptional repressor
MSTPSSKVVPAYHVEVLDRAFRLLDQLAEMETEPSASELAAKLELHKSTVHRLLAILERHRYLERNLESGRYRLGWRLFELGSLAVSRLDLYHRARPYVETLMRKTGETAHVGVLRGGELISIVNVETDRTVRTPATVGKRSPLYCTSQGKTLMAHLPEALLKQVLANLQMKAFTANTITQISRLKLELAMVRRRGYAMDNEEFEDGLRCIGAPVRNHAGAVVAAISIAGPAYRVGGANLPELIGSVVTVAGQLSESLGFREENQPDPRRNAGA